MRALKGLAVSGEIDLSGLSKDGSFDMRKKRVLMVWVVNASSRVAGSDVLGVGCTERLEV